MKQTFSLKNLITVLTGLMFAVYAAYNVFVIIRGRSYLPAIGLVILASVVCGGVVRNPFRLFVYVADCVRRYPLFNAQKHNVYCISVLYICAKAPYGSEGY